MAEIDHNTPAGASTSDGAPRFNAMTADQWLERVLYSGRITRVAQHLALVIYVLAARQQTNGVKASLRDLEKITGWGRATLHDHLGELDAFISVTFATGRAKSLFELQGLIEDAIGSALASGVMVKFPDATPDTSVVASQPDATPDAIVSGPPATTVVAAVPDTIPDANRVVARAPNTTPDATPYRERESNKRERERGSAVVEVNCEAIYGPNFTLSFASIDMASSLAGVPQERGRQIAEICARDWADNGTKPNSPMAVVKRAIAMDRNHKQTDDARQVRGTTVSSRSKLGDKAELARALREIEEEQQQRKSNRGVRAHVD